MADIPAAYLSVEMNDCVPVDGEFVHSPDAVAWSPHNVFLVATHGAVYLHVNALISAGAVIRPEYCSSDGTSGSLSICGAKWALDLVPEQAHPASCRLCIRTTRELFVYRVVRYGIGRLRVSCGLCFIPQRATSKSSKPFATPAKKSRKRASSSDETAVATSPPTDDDVQVTGAESSPGWCVVSYEWFPFDTLVVVTLGSIYLLNLEEDIADETAPQQRFFPAPAFCFSSSSLAGLSPSCAARVMGCEMNDMRLIVACPFSLLIFTVFTSHVSLQHYVEVPLLCGVPTAVCGLVDDVKNDATLRVFVSAPMCVLQGTIVGRASTDASAGSQPAQWTTAEVWRSETDFGDEIAVNRFLAVSLNSFFLPDVVKTPKMVDARAVSGKTCGGPFLVLGVCQRRLLGFLGRRCVELMRCAVFYGAELRRDVALALSGVAVHPSCTLAVVGLQFGARYYAPFQLLPVGVGCAGGFLSRFLQLHEGFSDIFDGNTRGRSSSPVRTATTTALPSAATAGANAGGTFCGLWSRQQSTSYFVWEELLPKSGFSAVLTRQWPSLEHSDGTIERTAAKEEKSIAELLPSFSQPTSPGIIRTLQQRYLEQRERYGLELFLRFPDADAEWRHLLLHIWRRCPGDVTLRELLLANAVQHMADKIQYAGFTSSAGRVMMSSGVDRAPHAGFVAAFQYGRLYHGRCSEVSGWIYRATFADQLGKFLDVVRTQWQQQQQQQKEHHTLDEVPRFPCSICLEKEQTVLTLSLSSNVDSGQAPQKGGGARDCADGLHFTVFSGRTFAPLSFVAAEEVVSRCHSCGLYDYVIGPLCAVCGGLMM